MQVNYAKNSVVLSADIFEKDCTPLFSARIFTKGISNHEIIPQVSRTPFLMFLFLTSKKNLHIFTTGSSFRKIICISFHFSGKQAVLQ